MGCAVFGKLKENSRSEKKFNSRIPNSEPAEASVRARALQPACLRAKSTEESRRSTTARPDKRAQAKARTHAHARTHTHVHTSTRLSSGSRVAASATRRHHGASRHAPVQHICLAGALLLRLRPLRALALRAQGPPCACDGQSANLRTTQHGAGAALSSCKVCPKLPRSRGCAVLCCADRVRTVS